MYIFILRCFPGRSLRVITHKHVIKAREETCNLHVSTPSTYNHWTGLVDWTKNHFYAL